MTERLRLLHMWVGLFNLTALIVFAVTGIVATFPHQESHETALVVPYTAPEDLTDKALADHLLEQLAFPLAGPIPDWAISRDAENVLILSYFTPNGTYRVTVLEEEGRVRIAHAREPLGEFMSLMHSTTFLTAAPDPRITLWALYMDISIASLIFMAATGIWLWLASRPRLWWAQTALAAGTGLFVALWAAVR